MLDFNRIKEAAQKYEADMTRFLRDIVKYPGESCGEKAHIDRIAEEMRKLDFDKVEIDPQGNVLGYMGTGKTLIGYDAHIDTVGIGNIDNWEFDPYEGFESETEIGGRGTSDQCGGIVSAVYGAKIMKDLGLLDDTYRVVVTGTVQEEDCDGLCWQYIINEDGVKPNSSYPPSLPDRWHLPRAAGTHGDPRRCKRRILPRLRSGARRQRDLQDGRYPAGNPRVK